MASRLIFRGGGVYEDTRTGHFFERPTVNGRRTWRKLKARNLKLAKELISAHRTDQARAEHGLARDPYAPPAVSVGELLKDWLGQGCAKTGHQLTQEVNRVCKLRPHFAKLQADQLRQSDCSAYWAYRRGKIKRGRGGRAVDLELATLAAVLKWAVRVGKLEVNPLGIRPKFRGKTVHHCRDFMPRDGDELHALAAHFFEERRSEALGWQLLIEAMTGCRTSEVLALRWDATNRHQAGFIEGDWLWLARAKGGVNPFCQIHPALRDTLEALARWRQWRHPKSPWFIPSFRKQGNTPVQSTSLTHALKLAGQVVCRAHRTSHGLRAFYVTVRRSQGISDAQIAAEIGDKSGASIIVSTYGAIPPNWQGQTALSWMPDHKPAWAILTDMPSNIVQIGGNRGMPAGLTAPGGFSEIRCKSLKDWRTHQELNLKPSDP